MPTNFNTSSRSALDARFNQYRINTYGADAKLTQDQIADLYSTAIKDLNAQGYTYDVSDFSVDPNTYELGLSSQGQDNYDTTNNANRNNTTTTIADTDDDFYETPKDIKTTVIDNSTTTGGEEIRTAFDVKESVDTSESQFWQDEVDDLKTDYQDARTKYLADNPGSTGIDWIKSEESRNLSAEIRDAEDSRDAAQINVTKNYDADGNLTGVTESQWDYRTGEYTELSNSQYQTSDQVNEKFNGEFDDGADELDNVEWSTDDTTVSEFDDGADELDNVEWSTDNTTVSNVNSRGNPVVDTDFDDDGNIVTTFADGTTQVQDENGNIISSTAPTTGELANNTANNENNYTNSQNIQNPANQPSVSELRKGVNPDDWRVRLRLAPQSDYLYNDPNPGILAPLKETDGVLFPYTPAITTSYSAGYSSDTLPHSNVRSIFYGRSTVNDVLMRAKFTAQDTKEANYLLAVTHFFKTITKMFYGQDVQRGTPPPLVFLSGFGEYQFNEHPCVVKDVTMDFPDDVDYIKAGDVNYQESNFLGPIDTNTKSKNTSNFISSSLNRLFGSGLSFGGSAETSIEEEIGVSQYAEKGITYVPTSLTINFYLIPVQTRSQVSNEFSLKDFSSGKLIKRGYW